MLDRSSVLQFVLGSMSEFSSPDPPNISVSVECFLVRVCEVRFESEYVTHGSVSVGGVCTQCLRTREAGPVGLRNDNTDFSVNYP